MRSIHAKAHSEVTAAANLRTVIRTREAVNGTTSIWLQWTRFSPEHPNEDAH